jgi:hypothetical protein
MNPFEFVLTILILVFGYKLLIQLMARKTQRRGDEVANGELLQRLAQVEERVQVLERIVTDERFDLKQQFKDLGA